MTPLIEEIMVHSRTVDSLLTIAGLVGITALGVFLGRNLVGHGFPRRDSGRRPADRESVADLVERFARTLPENEADIMRRRNRSRLQEW